MAKAKKRFIEPVLVEEGSVAKLTLGVKGQCDLVSGRATTCQA